MGFGYATRQATSFVLDKCKIAKRVFVDHVSQAELWTEEATNSEPQTPSARTMMQVANAAFQFDDYCRIIFILHNRLNVVNFKEWRQSYKALVLLDFLITHGPEGIAEEFLSDVDVIQQLGTFRHVDHVGFDWGSNMQKRSERILKLQRHQGFLNEERQNAMKLSRDINLGFGNSSRQPSPPPPPPSTSSSSSSSAYSAISLSPASKTSRASSFSSNTSDNSDSCSSFNKKADESIEFDGLIPPPLTSSTTLGRFRRIGRDDSLDMNGSHMWKDKDEDNTGSSLLDDDDDEEGAGGGDQEQEEKTTVAEKVGLSLRTISEVGKIILKTFDRRTPVGF